MALEGPRLVYTRNEEETDVLTKALRLAREIEELLEDNATSSTRDLASVPSLHAGRIVRAMSASLVDELEAIVRGTRKGQSSLSS